MCGVGGLKDYSVRPQFLFSDLGFEALDFELALGFGTWDLEMGLTIFYGSHRKVVTFCQISRSWKVFLEWLGP